MKTLKNYGALLTILMFLFSGSMMFAQEKSTEEEDKKTAAEAEMKYKQAEMQAKMEQEMQAKKEMLMQQQLEMKEKQQQMEEQQRQMREMERQYRLQNRELEQRVRESSRERSSGRSSWVTPEGNYVIASGFGQANQTQLTLRNTFQGEDSYTDGDFEVEEGVKHIRIMINGQVKNGEITIKIERPGGKEYKKMTIDSAAEVTFSQSLTVKEEDAKKYVGTWGYTVESDKAEGGV